MSGYGAWLKEHGRKHRAIVEKLKHLNKEALIEYFRYENMVQKEPDFCPLYAQNKKCHEMSDLNCYLCACPNFRFDDKGVRKEGERMLYSYCAIDSKDGSRYVLDDAIHQDCSKCLVPHKEAYIKEHFSRDWEEIMHQSDQSSSNSV